LISSTSYEQLLRAYIPNAQKRLAILLSFFGAYGIYLRKSCSKNVDEIDAMSTTPYGLGVIGTVQIFLTYDF